MIYDGFVIRKNNCAQQRGDVREYKLMYDKESGEEKEGREKVSINQSKGKFC